ncbi:hypothetical protein WA026_005957 [Henosepilachna vigintioctopunctata]|uniref:DNA polymerase zeta catalytic subunit n=1 Tax=Henosepilachna vigintioctopunctata TaxID=420089 RepID=A0AAW1U4W5_9CUCU
MEYLSVKIFDVDFYMCPPVQNLDITFSQFRGCAVHQVPVIRIFGSTFEGKKICVHVHGVFPYFFIPYDGTEASNGLMYKIASNLDRAINISLGQASSNTQHVYKMTLVSGIPFYGYHSKKHQFFKVYLYNPMFIKRANNLLFNEAILGKLYQPHETHLNFTLQFMIDYNLHGMSNIILSEVKYRRELNVDDCNDEEVLAKVSLCELECDTLGENIFNRKEVESGNLAANPGIAALWEDEQQRRRNKNEDSQLPHYLSLDKTNVPPTESHVILKRALQDRLMVVSEEREKNEVNLSVYPAECPRNKRLLNCSYIDFHSPQTSQSSFFEDSQLDNTMLDETLNITLDEDVQNLIDVLKDLEKNVSVEDDSLLSQISKDDGEEDDHDMTISIEKDSNLMDETIKISQICNEKSDDESATDNFFDLGSIKIPQLDGNCGDLETFKSIHSSKINDSKNSSSTRIQSRVAKSKYEHTLKPVCVNIEPLNLSKVYLELRKKKNESEAKRNAENRTQLKNLRVNLEVLDLKAKYLELEGKKQKRSKMKDEVLIDSSNVDITNSQLVVKLKRFDFSMFISKMKVTNTQSIYDPVPVNLKNNSLSDIDNNHFQGMVNTLFAFDQHLKKVFNTKSVSADLFSRTTAKYNQGSEIKVPNVSAYTIRLQEKKLYTQITKLKTDNSSDVKISLRDKAAFNKTTQYAVDLLNKRHIYFCAPSIGKRVLEKNLSVRKKFILKNQLEACRDSVILVKNLHVPQKITKVRNMPSLTNDFFSSESELELKPPNISNLSAKAKTPDIQRSGKVLIKVKKTIQRTTYRRKKTETLLSSRRYILAKELCRKHKKCMNMLKAGAKPIFKIVPGYRPYIFQDKNSNKRNASSSSVCREIVNKKPECKDNETIPSKKSINDIIAAQKKNEAQFFSSLSSMIEDYSINEAKILKYYSFDREYITSELINKRKQLLFLDGANDGSSEDEYEKKCTNRSCKKKRTTYSPLPILKQSAVSSAKGNPVPVNDQINSRMSNVKDDLKLIWSANKSASCDSIEKIKRNINFEFKSQNKTFVEEKLACKLRSEKLCDYKGTEHIVELSPKAQSKENIHELGKNKLSVSEGVEMLSKSEKNCNEDFLSSSAIYDIINDYQPQEGTSKCYENIISSLSSQGSSFNGLEKNKTISEQGQNKDDFKDKEELLEIIEEVPLNHVTIQSSQLFESTECLERNEEILLNRSTIQSSQLFESEEGLEENEDSPLNKTVVQSSWLFESEENLDRNEEITLNKTQSSKLLDSKENLESSEAIPLNKTATQLSESSSDIFSQGSSKLSLQKSVASNNLLYYKPMYKPPTRDDIDQSMHNLGITKIRAKEPFYGNVKDFTGGMEVCYNILKIKTLTTVDTPDFESSFDGIDSYRRKFLSKMSDETHSNKIHNSKYHYCRPSQCVITPARKPPTRQLVDKWLVENSLSKEIIKKSKPRKKKIYLMSSQDGCSDDSLDLSLTLTPLTPRGDDYSSIQSTPESESRDESKEINVDSDATLTPKSSRSRGCSPVITRRRGRKRRINRAMVLRKSALLSHSSENSGVISGVTLNNTYGFKNSVQNFQNARAAVQHDHLTIIAMELHVNTRENFRPNPQYDAIQAIFYCISNDVEEGSDKPRQIEGLFAVSPILNYDDTTKKGSCHLDGMGLTQNIKYVVNELDLFKEFTKFICDLDPDIMIGYEIQMLSWGYLVERCFHLGINIIPELSRVKDKHLKFNEKDTGDLRITGRVVLDFWRLLRHEIALQSYTLQSTVYEVLQMRIPSYSFKDLTNWWEHHTFLFRHRAVSYYLTQVRCQLKLLEQLDLVGRTSELARLFGIQFYEVLSRGSQFRVESMMLRLAKPLNYVAVSPSVQQRAKMKAPEHIALVLEPESKLYNDPVIVLDFQSLYPSIIIAYNYCFSTCIGKVSLLGKNEPFEFGATNLKISKERLKYFLKRNYLNFSPCGVGFVKKNVRDGIMPRMLREILDTRLMVKKSMKENKDDAVLQKVLHNRQLGLKLIANVTYGYTAANFSGRMPSVELGDSIVSKARETLQRTISLVDSNKEWGVRVVYGDTDSLFVHCPGKSREEAFSIGEKIVEAVGKENPDPVKLKLEKVYQPCILQTKKRYVGYMYESPDQKDPVYDAKGIETVRRDGCPAVSKMLEKSLRILFESKDVSRVKKYCLKQFDKIIMGRVSIQYLTFAKEYRGFTGYRPGACVPSLELAKKWVASDKRAEPRRGERVPYVIVNGPPGVPLIRLVRSPYELLNDPALRPNALYYITRVIIPPLNRCFNLIGADLNHWFHEMPRKQLQYLPIVNSPAKKTTISQYFVSTLCAVCSAQTQNGLCSNCIKSPQETVVILNEKIRDWEASYSNCKLICSTCTQILDEPKCVSLDCPVLYRLHQTNRDLQQADHLRLLLAQNFDI